MESTNSTIETNKDLPPAEKMDRGELVKNFFSHAVDHVRRRRNLDIDEMVKELAQGVPEALQEMVMRDMDRWEGYNAWSKETLKKEV